MHDSIREVLSGAFAGASTKTVLAPLDRLKLVVQLRGSIQQGSVASHYEGPWRALTKIIREEGFFALWRGNFSTIVIQGGTTALNFMFMDLYKKIASQVVVGDDQQQRIFQSFVSSALAGGTALSLLYPLGLMRTKLALDVGKEHRLYPRGMRDVFRLSYHANGLPSLYQGFSIALVSVSLYRMVHLGGYDFIKGELVARRRTQSQGRELSTEEYFRLIPFHERLVAAQFVSMMASTVHYPFDSVRRRLMMQSDVPRRDRKYRNARHCLVQIYRDEGMKGFYRGLGTTYIRSVGAALLLVSYDFAKQSL
eukprot:scaffold19_cov114-Cylindrotheca_fusiformis.AAC.27